MHGSVTRFGQVQFDAARGKLRVAGRAVALDRPSTAILAVLLDEAEQDVDKDRLLEAGWPDRIVHENSLAKAIGRLRQALGEDGRVLETVHGYGYRLATPVEAAAPPVADTLRPRRWPTRTVLAALAVVAGAGLLLTILAFPDRQTAAEQPLARGEPADALGRLLWVDDNPENNAEETRFFEDRKIAVYQARSSEEALALLAMYEYRAVISDMNRGDRPLAGLELVRQMRARRDRTPFYLYTYVPSEAQQALVTEAGGQATAVAPDQLYAAILPLFRR